MCPRSPLLFSIAFGSPYHSNQRRRRRRRKKVSKLERRKQNCHCLKVTWYYTQKLKVVQSVQFSSVAQSCLTLCNPMNHSTPGLPVHHRLLEFTQTHVHWVGDAIQPSHPLSSPSPPVPNPSQHKSLFQWVNSSHEVAEVLELQL